MVRVKKKTLESLVEDLWLPWHLAVKKTTHGDTDAGLLGRSPGFSGHHPSLHPYMDPVVSYTTLLFWTRRLAPVSNKFQCITFHMKYYEQWMRTAWMTIFRIWIEIKLFVHRTLNHYCVSGFPVALKHHITLHTWHGPLVVMQRACMSGTKATAAWGHGSYHPLSPSWLTVSSLTYCMSLLHTVLLLLLKLPDPSLSNIIYKT